MEHAVQGGARTVAGRYRLIEHLGSGGMGTVWRAEDTVLRREVAVKEVTFPPGVSDEEREVLRERTRREARTAAGLDHPSAVTVYDVAVEAGTPYLVMELVEARTLAEVVRTDGPLTPRDTAAMGLALLGALEAAHAKGIVHRDVKPGNVLLRPDGRVVLTDFGIATFTGDSSITSTGLLLGSPAYIAPERARGDQPGPPSDLWSLGATLFTAVEGRPPFDKGEPLPTITAVLTGDPEPFVAAGPLVPVLQGLLEKDPQARMSAAAAHTALTEIATSAGPVADTSSTPTLVGSAQAQRTTALSLNDVQHEAAEADVAPPAPRSYAPPRRTPPPRRSRTPAVLAALALITAGGVGVAMGALDREGPSSATGRSGTSSTAPGETSQGRPADAPKPADTSDEDGDGSRNSGTDDTEGGDEARAGVAELPEGWRSFTGSAGWVAAVPPSYAAGSFNGEAQYKDRASGRTLRVSTGTGKPDAVQDRRDQAASFAQTHDNYREISIKQIDYRGYPAADWEFTYSAGGTSLHVLSRVFVVGKTGYSLYFQTRASDDWESARAEFERMSAAFRPA